MYALLADGTTVEIRPAVPDDFEEAYEVFARSADTGAIKVVLTDAGV